MNPSRLLTIGDIPCADSKKRIDIGNNIQISIDTIQDICFGFPWKESDGHGIVSDWVSRSKYSSERLLSQSRQSYCYYDVAATMAIAKRDGWGMSQDFINELAKTLGRLPTRGQTLAAAVEYDFEYLRKWCNNEWYYMILSISINEVNDDGEIVREIDTSSVGGYESEGEYWKTEALSTANHMIKDQLKECEEKAFWEERGVETIN